LRKSFFLRGAANWWRCMWSIARLSNTPVATACDRI